MADIKISELDELQIPQNDDFIVINDTSSLTTKKITRENFLTGVAENIRDSGDAAVVNLDLVVANDLFVGGDIDATGNVRFGSLTDVINGATVLGFVRDSDGIENFDNNNYIPTTGAVIEYFQNRDPVYTFNLSSTTGNTNYTFTDANNIWFPIAENDPVLYLRRGETYRFSNVPTANPLEIRDGNGGSAYNTGVTNNGGSGAVFFAVPMNAPSTLYYQSTANAAMGNTINIV